MHLGMASRAMISTATLFALGLVSSCSGDSGSGSGSHSSGEGTATVALNVKVSDSLSAVGLSSLSDVSTMAVGDRESFTLSSFKAPVMKIILSGESGNLAQTLYACPNASEADCLVDLADASDLASLSEQAQSASVATGTYNRISIHTCTDAKSGADLTTIKVTGEGLVENTRYITKAGPPSAAASVSDVPEEVEIDNWACGTQSISISPAVVVSDGASLKLTVAVDHSLAAAFSTGLAPAPIGMCDDSSSDPNDYRVCLAYPAALGYVGDGVPTMKRFFLTHSLVSANLDDDKANALIVVAVDESSEPLAAFWRPIVTPTSAEPSGNNVYNDANYGGPNYGTESGEITVNTDGTIAFGEAGTVDLKAAIFTNFQVDSHTGTVETRDGDTWFYEAIEAN